MNIDWKDLGFGYMPCAYRYVAEYKNGSWQDGKLSTDANITLNESACVFQYAQTVFEGLKAYRTKDDRVVCFRPDLNAKRLKESAERLMIPPYKEEDFLKAIEEVVRANWDYIPPYESGASLYIRPYMMGTNPVIGVKPADEYMFRVFVSPRWTIF